MLHKQFIQDLATYNFLSKKLIHLKIFKAVLKNNPRTQSSQQNKKTVLTTAVYLKVSTPVRPQKQ